MDGQELLPATRDAYLHGALTAPEVTAVETVLRGNAVERGLTLARCHELSAKVRRRRPAQEFRPPAWVQQQLLLQPSVSAWGPLRRPSMQLGVGLFLAFSVASGVQWVRNKPLIPAPVVASLKQASRTLSRATQRLVSSAPLPAEAATDSTSWLALAPARPAAKDKAEAAPARPQPVRRAVAAIVPLTPTAVRPTLAATGGVGITAADSAATRPAGRPTPVLVANVMASAAPAGTAARHVVRGHVLDFRGQPLAGATVLVKGTGQATSTNASGAYSLEAPVGALLLVGYAGCLDQVLTAAPTTDGQDVTMEPVRTGRHASAAQL